MAAEVGLRAGKTTNKPQTWSEFWESVGNRQCKPGCDFNVCGLTVDHCPRCNSAASLMTQIMAHSPQVQVVCAACCVILISFKIEVGGH